MKKIIYLFVSLSFVSCANYTLKKQCEETNWFDYSQKVAFSGRYLEEDKTLLQMKSRYEEGLKTFCTADPALSAQRKDLISQLDSLPYNINLMRTKKESLNSEIQAFESELLILK